MSYLRVGLALGLVSLLAAPIAAEPLSVAGRTYELRDGVWYRIGPNEDWEVVHDLVGVRLVDGLTAEQVEAVFVGLGREVAHRGAGDVHAGEDLPEDSGVVR